MQQRKLPVREQQDLETRNPEQSKEEQIKKRETRDSLYEKVSAQ